ncbi:MAG: hypothetical protein RLZZ524_2294 [Pseudomonadota bacterium]|jgi:hypothetical protein
MSSLTNFAEAALLNALLRNTAYSPANSGQTWCNLYTAAPTDAGGGTECSTGTYSAYARQSFGGTPSTAWTVTAGDPTTAVNNNALTFGAVGATPQAVVAFGIIDSATLGAGNLLGYTAISTVTFNNTDVPQVAVGGIQVTMT